MLRKRLNVLLMVMALALVGGKATGLADFLVSPVSKNVLGDMLFYDRCPHCWDSLMWKKAGHLPAEKFRGVQLCEDCLRNIASLNTRRIMHSLIERKWSEERIIKALVAIKLYQREVLDNIREKSI